jgi:hypothetical protein
MNFSRSTLALVALSLVNLAPAWAASVNVVHGIDGRDLSLARDLPVDIAVNGSCTLKGVTFTQSALVELTPATYNITVHVADGACRQSPVITQSVTIPNDQSDSFSLVASLSQAGTPQLAVFNNTKNFLPRVAVRHLAFAGPLSVRFRSRDLFRPKVSTINNGEFAKLSLFGRIRRYKADVFSLGKQSLARIKTPLVRISGRNTREFVIYNIVGSSTNGFTAIFEGPALQPAPQPR